MTNDHGVRVIALSDFDHVDHFDLSVGGHTICVSKDQDYQERSADAIRKAIENARTNALDEFLDAVAREAALPATYTDVRRIIAQLKERDDG